MSNNPPSESKNVDSINYYDQNAQAFFDSTANLDMSSLYRKFEKYLPPSAHILDAGCGSGRDTQYFIGKGYRVTAFDASLEMVKMASSLSGHPIQHMTFQDLVDVNIYDGIWACASILHVEKAQINDVFQRLIRALKSGGIFYMSFKYGNGEVTRHERLFNNYNEESFLALLKNFPEVTPLELWVTEDIRPGRETEKWLNAILKRINVARA